MAQHERSCPAALGVAVDVCCSMPERQRRRFEMELLSLVVDSRSSKQPDCPSLGPLNDESPRPAGNDGRDGCMCRNSVEFRFNV